MEWNAHNCLEFNCFDEYLDLVPIDDLLSVCVITHGISSSFAFAFVYSFCSSESIIYSLNSLYSDLVFLVANLYR